MILKCLIAADELGLDKLIEHIQEYLINNVHKDPVSTLQVIYQHEPFEGLKNYCLEIITNSIFLDRLNVNLKILSAFEMF